MIKLYFSFFLVTSPRFNVINCLRSLIVGASSIKDEIIAKEQQKQLEKHLDEIAHLEQSTWEKAILNANLVLILIGAVALYSYFSINPFSPEDLSRIRANLTDMINSGHEQ